MPNRPRVILALPDNLECAAVSDWLVTEGLDPVVRASVQTAVDEMAWRPFDLLIADDTFVFRRGLRAGRLIRNPMTPIIVVGAAPTPSARDAAAAHIMYVPRPIDRALFACFVQMAMSDGRPVRRSIRKPVTRFDAAVNGVPVRLVDVSSEGLRIEMPPGRIVPGAPMFNVRVPVLGVTITVKRMWGRAADAACTVASCGAALAQNRPLAEGAWRAFVDSIPVPAAADLANA
jgi:hypothetical protein